MRIMVGPSDLVFVISPGKLTPHPSKRCQWLDKDFQNGRSSMCYSVDLMLSNLCP